MYPLETGLILCCVALLAVAAHGLLNSFIFWSASRSWAYRYGVVYRPEDGYCRHARRNIFTKKVQFILRESGRYGRTQDFWCEFGSGWEVYFIKGKSTDDYIDRKAQA